MRNYGFKILVSLLLLVCCGAIVIAENLRELRGRVIDETNAFIVAATLTLDDGQGHSYTGQTDEQGKYYLKGIVPGKYSLTVKAEGFDAITQQVDLSSHNIPSFNITLKVLITEQLEVRTDSTDISVEPDKNLSAITLTQQDLEALPDDPDELLQTLREMAGASGGGGGDANLIVDGFREGGRLPPKESIQQIRINANPFAAEYSEPGNSRIEIITKPGSDKLRGSFRFNFNDESLNGRNAFAGFRSPLQIRSFSGNLGGPIIRNRWGFFVDIDKRNQNENDIVNATVLDPVTLLALPFVTTVLTPTSVTNLQVRSDYLFRGKHTLGFSYRYTKNESENQGLDSGFDLPERAFNRMSKDNTLRLSFTSIVSEHAVNEFRMELNRRSFGSKSLSDDPAILVFDSFNMGGNQGALFSNNTSSNMEMRENLSYTHKNHSMKFGVQAEAVRLENINRSNFGGTFSFGTDFERDSNGTPVLDGNGLPIIITSLEHYRRTLTGLPGYLPSQFSIVQGDPFIGFTQWQVALFAQDDWRVSPRLTVSYGVRHELQSHLDDKINFAPRFGLAFVPDKQRKSTIRFGTGVFYNEVDTGITFDTTRLNGEHQQQFVLQRPAFFPEIPTVLAGAAQRISTIRIKADGLNSPYSILSTVSYDRQLPKKIFSSVVYSYQRAVHLLRTRNINAPNPEAILSGGPVQRPFPDRGPILQYESTGLSTRHELRFNARTNINNKFTIFGNYILSWTRSDTDGSGLAPANSYDLSTEFGRASFDQRHRFFITGSFSLPHGMRVSPFVIINSGRPFNITTGRDNNNDTLFTDRPAFTTADDPEAVITRYGIFNPNPRPGDRIIPRNFGDGPGQVSVNLNISKTFGFGPQKQVNRPNFAGGEGGGQLPQRIGAGGGPGGGGRGGGGGGFGGFGGFNEDRYRYNMTLSMNVQNLFNHTNPAGFNGVLTSPIFGIANRSLASRRVELALRFSF